MARTIFGINISRLVLESSAFDEGLFRDSISINHQIDLRNKSDKNPGARGALSVKQEEYDIYIIGNQLRSQMLNIVEKESSISHKKISAKKTKPIKMYTTR